MKKKEKTTHRKKDAINCCEIKENKKYIMFANRVTTIVVCKRSEIAYIRAIKLRTITRRSPNIYYITATDRRTNVRMSVTRLLWPHRIPGKFNRIALPRHDRNAETLLDRKLCPKTKYTANRNILPLSISAIKREKPWRSKGKDNPICYICK